MADSIKYTNGCWNYLIPQAIKNGTSGVIGDTVSWLYIMKGTIPTGSTAQDMLSSYITSTRSADILIKFTLNGMVSPSTTGNVAAFTPLPYTAATATGTATWFAIAHNNNSYIIYGDVTDATGTGFLRLNTVSIVNGTVYKVADAMTINFANEYITG